MIANEKEFDEALKKLGELYEEGKDKAQLVYFDSTYPPAANAYDRLLEILQEMRDLSAVTMQKLHFKAEN